MNTEGPKPTLLKFLKRPTKFAAQVFWVMTMMKADYRMIKTHDNDNFIKNDHDRYLMVHLHWIDKSNFFSIINNCQILEYPIGNASFR